MVVRTGRIKSVVISFFVIFLPEKVETKKYQSTGMYGIAKYCALYQENAWLIFPDSKLSNSIA